MCPKRQERHHVNLLRGVQGWLTSETRCRGRHDLPDCGAGPSFKYFETEGGGFNLVNL